MKTVSTEDNFDVIVIGSGIGGLTAASLLTQLGHKRVLVLERHFKLGGLTHTFERNGYSWDVGLHYVGQMGEGTQFRRLFDLITRHGVQWNAMPPVFERFVYPGLSFGVPSHAAEYRQALVQQFPDEQAAIVRYFQDIERATGWFNRYVMRNLMPRLVSTLLTLPDQRLAMQTTQQYLDTHFHDARLKALLASQWGDYGLPPMHSTFAIHALIVSQYLDGGYYPEGGAGVIADSIVPIIEAGGGKCLVNHRVSEIVIENGRAVGVHVAAHGKRPAMTYYAPLIISAAGAYTTYTRLLPANLNLPQRDDLHMIEAPSSAVTIYIGFKDSPASLGFAGENHWIYTGYDHAEMFARRHEIINGMPAFAYLSFGSLRDTQATRHTAQIIAWTDYASFAPWQDQRWQKRAEEYTTVKERMAKALIDLVDQHYPGFRDLVEYYEVSTPLTVEHFTGQHRGGIYSVPATPDRFRSRIAETHTPVPGLMLTGADVVSLGINGAMMGGVMTAAAQLGPDGYFQIMRATRREPQPTLSI